MISSGKDMSAGSSAASMSKYKKCKYLISNGVNCINCGSVNDPSCATIKNVKFISDTQMSCCDGNVLNVANETEINSQILLAMEALLQKL